MLEGTSYAFRACALGWHPEEQILDDAHVEGYVDLLVEVDHAHVADTKRHQLRLNESEAVWSRRRVVVRVWYGQDDTYILLEPSFCKDKFKRI